MADAGQQTKALRLSLGDYWSGGDGCSDGGRNWFAALWVEDESHEEKIVRGAGLMSQDEADFRFDVLRRAGRGRAAEQKAVVEAAAVQGEAALTAAQQMRERQFIRRCLGQGQ